MQISAQLIKDLRQRTGAGMLDCKKALQQTAGDIELAIVEMRKRGMASASEKAGRIAAQGVVTIRNNEQACVMLEVNCETDFVARDDSFSSYVGLLANTALINECADIETLLACETGGSTLEEQRLELVSRIGENIIVRRLQRLRTERHVGRYVHADRIGVLVELEGGDVALAKDLAMHIAASKPLCVAEKDLPRDILDKERAIYAEQEADNGKPPEITEKIVAGRLRKFIAGHTLLGQKFVKDEDLDVEALLRSSNAGVLRFYRFELGEGLQRHEGNFVEEVMAQANRNQA